MFNWFKKKSKHDCAKDASFVMSQEAGPYTEAMYTCRICYKEYQALQYKGGTTYINPVLKKFFRVIK